MTLIRKLPNSKTWKQVQDPCRHPEHNFPTMIVLEPGVWEHTCPGCRHTSTVSIMGATW